MESCYVKTNESFFLTSKTLITGTIELALKRKNVFIQALKMAWFKSAFETCVSSNKIVKSKQKEICFHISIFISCKCLSLLLIG